MTVGNYVRLSGDATPDICHGITCIKGHFRPHLNARRLNAMNAQVTPALQATNIHQSFGHVDALRGVNLTLMPGEIVALLGVNGAGIRVRFTPRRASTWPKD